jgi:polyisoprenoid-binding protein YceI
VPRYRIVPEKSRVWIEARSSLHPINSTTDGLEGYIDLGADDGDVDVGADAAGKLSLPVDRLSSGNRLEDRELHKRIDARRYPTIDGVLTGIRRADGDGSYRVSGELTFRGVAKNVEDDMTIEVVDERTLRLEGTSQFDIRDFGMEPPRILMLKVEPRVDVRVDIVATIDETGG